MLHNKPGTAWLPLRIILLCALLLVCLPIPTPTTHAQAQQQTRRINGFDVSGRFLQVWSSPGSDQQSIYLNGLPITPQRPEISLSDGKTYSTQWFERASYQHHPQNQPPHDVQLALLGSRIAEGRASIDATTGKARYAADQSFLPVQKPAEANTTTSLWFPETGHTLSGKFLQYWRQYGGLPQFGFPLSEPFTEISPTDGKTYSVQYFERNRFELHPDKPAPYEVELGLLGVQLYKQQAIGSDQLPIAPPTGVTNAKDTFVQGSLQEPSTLVGLEENTDVLQGIIWAVTFQDALVGFDDKENLFPLAAWYVPTLENGGSYFTGIGDDRHMVTKFKLRQGIKWADGVELTSNDAVFSYGLIINDPQGSSSSLQVKIANIDNPDKYTIIYNWMSLNDAKARRAEQANDPKFAFLDAFINARRPVIDKDYVFIGTVHPRHVMANLPIDKLQQSSYAEDPIGYGPFRVQEWTRDDQMVLVQNEHYNLTGKPLFKTIIIEFNPDVSYQVNAYLIGQIDGIASNAVLFIRGELNENHYAQLRNAGAVVALSPSYLLEHLEFSFWYEPFKDKRVRQAIAHGINRKEVIDIAFRGAMEIPNGPVLPAVYHSLDNPGFATEFPDLAARYKLPAYDFDPATANRLLDEAGWLAPCGNPAQCVREKDRVKLEFKFIAHRAVLRQKIQKLVSGHLKQVGVGANIDIYPTSAPWTEEGEKERYTCCALFVYAVLSSTTSGFDLWATDAYPEDGRRFEGSNYHGYSNPKVDAANRLFKIEVERSKIAEQSAISQVELMNDIALLPLASRPVIDIYSPKLKNRKLTNNPSTQWWNITQWYFDP